MPWRGNQHPVHPVEFDAWRHMRRRCDSTKDAMYYRYGGRGISYDPRWNLFANFITDMGPRPAGHELDRVDNDGHYCKANCRWATRVENQNNKGNNRRVEFRGATLTITELSRVVGMNESTLYDRIVRSGWPVDQAATRPKHSRIKSPA